MSSSNAQQKKISARQRWQKVPLLISDVQPTARDDVIEITLSDDGRVVRLRRDLCEFFSGKVFVPLWLFERLNDAKLKWVSDMRSLVEFCGEVRRETEKAYLVFDGQHEIWLPKSVIFSERRIPSSRRNDFIFEIPEWLAKEKGIV